MDLELLSLSEAWESFNWLIAAGLFVLYCFVEFLDSGLTLMITRHESMKSASTTFLLYLILGIEVLAFVHNYLYVIPTALGAWLGVYLLVEHEKKVRPIKAKK
jgi:hypothetical protein